MNQILATENIKSREKTGKKGQADINSVIKFFAIILIIFGIFMIASSSYALYKNNNEEPKEDKEPEIQLENKTEEELLLKVMHDKEINKVIYNWNNEEEQQIEGNGRKYIEEKITIPSGTNTLNIKAIDINGKETERKKTYTLKNKSGIEIDIKLSENNIRINVNGQEEISYLKYKWDDGEEEQIDINDTEFSTEIEALKGEHELTVSVIDINNNKEEKTQKVVGTTKPSLRLEKGDDCYVIKATDELELRKIEIKTLIDGKTFTIQAEGKEFEYNFPLKEGENRVEVTAYNSNNVASDTIKARWKK